MNLGMEGNPIQA